MLQVQIEHAADVLIAQQIAKRGAQAMGFPRAACAELMIVASELSSNILKYGKRGLLRIEGVHDPARGGGVRLTAEDEGPPFKNFDAALQDGWSDDGPVDPAALYQRKGTASGLGAVRRMTDDVCWEPIPGGKAVIATRYLSRGRRRPAASR
jgi:anti-sigma regulatory factor (Ser/Thr protein kinase)